MAYGELPQKIIPGYNGAYISKVNHLQTLQRHYGSGGSYYKT
jgi:hypothetical protein